MCSLPGARETAVGAMCNGDGTCYYPFNTDAPCDDGELCNAIHVNDKHALALLFESWFLRDRSGCGLFG